MTYYYEEECEHEGDIQRSIADITQGDAVEIVKVDIPNHGDHDYYVTIYFKILDEKKFTESTGYKPSDFCCF